MRITARNAARLVATAHSLQPTSRGSVTWPRRARPAPAPSPASIQLGPSTKTTAPDVPLPGQPDSGCSLYRPSPSAAAANAPLTPTPKLFRGSALVSVVGTRVKFPTRVESTPDARAAVAQASTVVSGQSPRRAPQPDHDLRGRRSERRRCDRTHARVLRSLPRARRGHQPHRRYRPRRPAHCLAARSSATAASTSGPIRLEEARLLFSGRIASEVALMLA